VTTGCNFPEVETEGAGCVVGATKEQIGEGILKMLSLDPVRRAAMGAMGQKLVSGKYSLDIVARKMLTIYRCIMAGAKIPLHPECSY